MAAVFYFYFILFRVFIFIPCKNPCTPCILIKLYPKQYNALFWLYMALLVIIKQIPIQSLKVAKIGLYAFIIGILSSKNHSNIVICPSGFINA